MMKTLLAILILTSALTLVANAQTLTGHDLMARGEMGIDTGYQPKSLESMVGSSALIIKGRYEKFLGSKAFFGYSQGGDETIESIVERTGMPEDEVKQFLAFPMSEYEIIVDEVLMGEVSSNRLVLRIGGDLPGQERLTSPDKDRLFFLVMNPDKRTYSRHGETGILTAEQGVYAYDSFVLLPGIPRKPSFVAKPLEFMPSMAEEDFEAALRTEIARSKGSE